MTLKVFYKDGHDSLSLNSIRKPVVCMNICQNIEHFSDIIRCIQLSGIPSKAEAENYKNWLSKKYGHLISDFYIGYGNIVIISFMR